MLVVALTGCGEGIQLGEAPSTTTTVTTTTTAPPATTTTRPRKPRVEVTAPKPAAPTVTEAPGEESIEILPEHIEDFLVYPAGWRHVADREFGTGPIDLDRAAADEAAADGNVEEARRYMEELGFVAGYSRAWYSPESKDVTAIVTLYLFGTVEAARVYGENSLAEMEALTDPGQWEEMAVGDVPGARGFTGGNADDGFASLVVFSVDGVFVGVSCESWTSRRNGHRYCAHDMTKLQYDHLVALLASS